MKKNFLTNIICFVLAVTIAMTASFTQVVPIFAEAHSVELENVTITADNITWSYNDSTATLNIGGTGVMSDYQPWQSAGAPWFEYLDDVVTVNIGDNVESIGDFAFYEATNLTTVTGGAGVKSVAINAFTDSAWLNDTSTPYKVIGSVLVKYTGNDENVIIPNTMGIEIIGLNAFYDNKNITSVKIPVGVTDIEYNAFGKCDALADVTLPNGLKTIGADAFYENAISSIVIPNSVLTVGQYAFAYCPNLISVICSDSLEFGEYAFLSSPYDDYFGECGNTAKWKFDGIDTLTISGTGVMSFRAEYMKSSVKESIKKVVVGEGISAIGENSWNNSGFYGMTNLKEVLLPSTVKEFASYAFYNTALESFEIPASVTYVGSYAFANTKLKEIIIPKTLTGLTTGVFKDCKELKTLTIESDANFDKNLIEGCTSLEKVIFNGSDVNANALSGNTIVENVVIGSNVKRVDNSAFANCSSLRSVTIEEGVEEIGMKAFEKCKSLKEVSFPVSLNIIEDYAFEGCSVLDKVTFKEGLESIGEYAFRECSELKEVTIPYSVTNIGYFAFHGYEEYFEDPSDEKGGYNIDYAYDTDFIMNGYINTEAEEYASNKEYKVTFVPIGGKIADCVLELSQTEYTYDGTAKEPTATLVSKYGVVPIDQVTITYSNNVNVGTATVTATYIGNTFESNGSKVTANFTIKASGSSEGAGSSQTATSEEVQKLVNQLLEEGILSQEVMAEIREKGSEEETLAYAKECIARMGGETNVTPQQLADFILGKTSSDEKNDPTHTHSFNYVSNEDETVLADGTKTGTCACGETEVVANVGSKLSAFIEVPATKFALKTKQVYKGFKVTMGKGDTIISVEPKNTKLVKVSSLKKEKGTFTLTALKKVGKTTVTITLASGLTKQLAVTVQKKEVKTTKISGLKSTITLKKGQSVALKPVITPITSIQKVSFKISFNKKVATVSAKGVIKAKKKGIATLTVTSGSVKKNIKVKVK